MGHGTSHAQTIGVRPFVSRQRPTPMSGYQRRRRSATRDRPRNLRHVDRRNWPQPLLGRPCSRHLSPIDVGVVDQFGGKRHDPYTPPDRAAELRDTLPLDARYLRRGSTTQFGHEQSACFAWSASTGPRAARRPARTCGGGERVDLVAWRWSAWFDVLGLTKCLLSGTSRAIVPWRRQFHH